MANLPAVVADGFKVEGNAALRALGVERKDDWFGFHFDLKIVVDIRTATY